MMKQLDESVTFEHYKKIAIWTFRFNKMRTALMEIAITFFGLTLIFSIPQVLIAQLSNNSYLYTWTVIMLDIFFVAFFISFVFLLLEIINEMFRKYQIIDIVKICFERIAESKNIEQRNIYLRHLLYNLERIRNRYDRPRSFLIQPATLSTFFEIYEEEGRKKAEIVRKVIEFIGSSLIVLDNKLVKRAFIDLGKCFKEKQFAKMLTILNDKQLNNAINIAKIDLPKTGIKGKIERIWNFISNNKLATYIFLVILYFVISIVVYSMGIRNFPSLPYP